MTGSYGTKEDETILTFALDTESRQIVKLCGAKGFENPSFILMHPGGTVLYSVEELNPAGRICACRMDNGVPVKVKSMPSGGADPCHLSLDPMAQFLFVSNYSSGSLGVFRLDQDKMPAEMTDLVQHTGRGPVSGRQDSAHVHFSKWIGDLLYSCDLGEDKVYVYRLDRGTGRLAPAMAPLEIPAGYGPRHLIWKEDHPELVYVLTELAAKLLVYRWTDENSAWRLAEETDTIDEGIDRDGLPVADQNAFGAAIKINEAGDLLAVSVRGADTIVLFDRDNDGMLNKIGSFSSGGAIPRDFSFFGDCIVAANQLSDNLRLLTFDRENRTLDAAEEAVQAQKPVCVLPC